MEFNDVVDMVLNLMTDYKYINYSTQELRMELAFRTNMVLAKAGFEDLIFNINEVMFSRTITILEATIIAYGLLVQWLSPIINNREALSAQLTSKEITAFSNANRVQAGIQLYNLASDEFYYLLTVYDDRAMRESWAKENV